MKLDFGLSHTMLSEEFRKAWPYEFGLVYSVTLTKTSLQTQLQVRNEGTQNFEFQVLMHTYLNIAVCLSSSWLFFGNSHLSLDDFRLTEIHRISPLFASRTSSPRPTSTRPARLPPTPKPPRLWPSPEKPTAFTRTLIPPCRSLSPLLQTTNLCFRLPARPWRMLWSGTRGSKRPRAWLTLARMRHTRT